MKMKTTLKIFIRTLKQTIRSPTRITLIVAFPMLFVLVFAFIFGGSGDVSPTSVIIGVINEDGQDYLADYREIFYNYTLPWAANATIDPLTHGFGNFFVRSLDGQTGINLSNQTFRILEFKTIEEALKAVQSRAVTFAIYIPYDFSLGMLSGINSREYILDGSPILNQPEVLMTNVSLTLLGDPNFLSFQEGLTEFQESLHQFSTQLFGIELPAGIFTTAFTNVSSYELTQFDYFISGFFTFGLVLTSSSVAGILGEEREYRTLDRLKISQIKPIELLGGITLNQIVVAGAQLLMMLLAAYLFGFKGRGSPLLAYFVGLLTLIPILGLAFFVSAWVPNGRDASSVIAMVSAPIGFLSGAFLQVPAIPLIADFIPTGTGTFRTLQLWDFFPFYSSVTAIRNVLLFDHTLGQILPELVFLLIGGALFFVFGMIFFIWRVFRPEK